MLASLIRDSFLLASSRSATGPSDRSKNLTELVITAGIWCLLAKARDLAAFVVDLKFPTRS